jgi:hypothetical protein
MTTPAGAALSERRMIADGLRLSVRLAHSDEVALVGAAVELIIRGRAGEFADPGWPWIIEGGPADALGLFRLDPDAMTAWDSGRPAHPVMALVEALAGGRPVRRLPQLLPVLDAPTQRLSLTAFHHAALGEPGVAVYAFGGDPWQLINGGPELRFWPTCELDIIDRPAIHVQARLTAAGGAR